MAIGSNDLKIANLDAMDNEQLAAQIKKSKEELFNLRFQSATDQLDNHGRLKAVRKDIARIETVLRERELGIRSLPEVVAPAAAKKSDKKSDKKADKKDDKKEAKSKKEDK
jgi:large subunit ribosomal protein L29